MSTEQTWRTESAGLEETLALAEGIGSRVRGGEIFVLASDLGGGKTAFVRGLAKGMGSTDDVHSPSFTVSNEYEADTLRLYHFDFYRLNEPGIMRDELSEVVADPQAVVAIEWADIVENVLPADHILVKITPTSDTERQFRFTYPDTFNALFPSNT